MFKKLKEKLKSSISKLTKKTEEEILEGDKESPKIDGEILAEEEKTDIKDDLISENIEESDEREGSIREEKRREADADKDNAGKSDRAEDKEEVLSTREDEARILQSEREISDKRASPSEPKEKADETKEKDTSKGIFKKAKEIFTTKRISESKFDELFWDMEIALMENNVSLEVIEKIKEDLKDSIVDKQMPRNVAQHISKTLTRSIDDILSSGRIDLTELSRKKPLIITLFGINGSGKTTTLAKLAYMFRSMGKSCVFAAADTFRAAAIDQLEEHAKKLGIKIIKHEYGSDSAAVAYDAVQYAEKNSIDIVLIDTAGRLHSNTNLMDELEKICRVVKPDLKIFIGESITGNDCVEQAKEFNSHIGFDGIILTKADIDEKGGAPLSISYVTKKPILFIGTGQEYGDIRSFDKEEVMKNLGLKD